MFILLAADVKKRILLPFEDNAKWNGVEGSQTHPETAILFMETIFI